MKEAYSSVLIGAVLRILTPLIRILLRNGVAFGAFTEIARKVYVDLAMNEFQLPGRARSISRAAILTGLSRKEVKRVSEIDEVDASQIGERYNRAARVISGWRRDARFHDAEGQPAVLAIQSGTPNFSDLVREHSGDVPVRAILDELLQAGAVEKTDDDNIRLLNPAYIPATSQVDKVHILGTDVSDMIKTIDHNLDASPATAFFQRKVAYDNLSEEAVEEFRPMAFAKSQELLEIFDAWLSLRDRDSNPQQRDRDSNIQQQGNGRKRAGIGIYYFEDNENLVNQPEHREISS